MSAHGRPHPHHLQLTTSSATGPVLLIRQTPRLRGPRLLLDCNLTVTLSRASVRPLVTSSTAPPFATPSPSADIGLSPHGSCPRGVRAAALPVSERQYDTAGVRPALVAAARARHPHATEAPPLAAVPSPAPAPASTCTCPSVSVVTAATASAAAICWLSVAQPASSRASLACCTAAMALQRLPRRQHHILRHAAGTFHLEPR